MKNKMFHTLLSLIGSAIILQGNPLNIPTKLEKKWENKIYYYLSSQLPKVRLDDSINKNIARYIYSHAEKNLPQKWFFDLNKKPVLYLYVPSKIYLYKNLYSVEKVPYFKSYIMNNEEKVLGNDIYFIPLSLNTNQAIKIALFNKKITKPSRPLLLAVIYPEKLIRKANEKHFDIYHALLFFKSSLIKEIKTQLQNELKQNINIIFLEKEIFKEYEKLKNRICPTSKQIEEQKVQFEWESKAKFFQRIKKLNKLASECSSDYKEFHFYFKEKVKQELKKMQKNINQALKYALNSQQIDNLTLFLLNKYVGSLKITKIKRDYTNGEYTYLKIVSQKKHNGTFFVNSFFKIKDKHAAILKQLKSKTKQIVFNKKKMPLNLFKNKNLKNNLYPVLGKYNGQLTVFLINEYDWNKNISFTSLNKIELNGIGHISSNSYFIPKNLFNYKVTERNIDNSKRKDFKSYVYNIKIISPIKTFWIEKKVLQQTQTENVLLGSMQNKANIQIPRYTQKNLQINLTSNIKINVKNSLNLPILKTDVDKLKIKFPKWFLKDSDMGYGYDKNLNLAILKAKQNLLIQIGKISIKTQQKLSSIKGNFVDYQVMSNKIEEVTKAKDLKIKVIKKDFLNGYWFIAIKSNKN